MIHPLLLCALLTLSQTRAVCWRVSIPHATCERLMTDWLADARQFYARNPDVVPMPQVSCGEDAPLPPGATVIADVSVANERLW